MDEATNKAILDEIDQAIAEGENNNTNESSTINNHDNKNINNDKIDSSIDKKIDSTEICIKLDPVENVAECMALAIEAGNIHYGILNLIRVENTFSEAIRDKKPEEIEKIFTEECIKIFKKKSLLELYIEKIIISILEDTSFNYAKKLPRLLLMTSYCQKKKDHDPDFDVTPYHKLVELDEEGDYVITKNFEKLVKQKSSKNIDFALECIIDIWVKRMMQETCFEVLKKKIQKFLMTQDYMKNLKTQLDSYLKYQVHLAEEQESLKQHALNVHSELRKG
ncbi:hypothetical protein [Romboutsia sp.]|uniref:hypothetical protein n=1 Tax=Romboutsia sp. TaxID=1965302 RepID=UPI003F2AB244